MKIKTLSALLIITLLGFYLIVNGNTSPFEKKGIAQLKNGDMIFQTSESSQCEAVRIATNSKFSHCGIIFIENEKPMVYEAVQPVKITPLNDWITHGKNGDYVIKRLKNNPLSEKTISAMKLYATTLLNKDYDLYFEWNDDKIYCSEYVWKIYKNAAAIELCTLESLKNFNLKDKKVQEILKQRYGNKIPLEEKVVAPSQLVASPLVETIVDTY